MTQDFNKLKAKFENILQETTPNKLKIHKSAGRTTSVPKQRVQPEKDNSLSDSEEVQNDKKFEIGNQSRN